MDKATRTWEGNWRTKVAARIGASGSDSITAFLAERPAVPYIEMAENLGEDVAAIQLSQIQFEEAKSVVAIRDAAMDSLPRDLNYYLPQGWVHGALNHFETSRAFAVWGTRVEQRDQDMKLKVDAVWAVLERLRPPAGWKPTGPTDPLIQQAFDAGWPLASTAAAG